MKENFVPFCSHCLVSDVNLGFQNPMRESMGDLMIVIFH